MGGSSTPRSNGLTALFDGRRHPAGAAGVPSRRSSRIRDRPQPALITGARKDIRLAGNTSLRTHLLRRQIRRDRCQSDGMLQGGAAHQEAAQRPRRSSRLRRWHRPPRPQGRDLNRRPATTNLAPVFLDRPGLDISARTSVSTAGNGSAGCLAGDIGAAVGCDVDELANEVVVTGDAEAQRTSSTGPMTSSGRQDLWTASGEPRCR